MARAMLECVLVDTVRTQEFAGVRLSICLKVLERHGEFGYPLNKEQLAHERERARRHGAELRKQTVMRRLPRSLCIIFNQQNQAQQSKVARLPASMR